MAVCAGNDLGGVLSQWGGGGRHALLRRRGPLLRRRGPAWDVGAQGLPALVGSAGLRCGEEAGDYSAVCPESGKRRPCRWGQLPRRDPGRLPAAAARPPRRAAGGLLGQRPGPRGRAAARVPAGHAQIGSESFGRCRRYCNRCSTCLTVLIVASTSPPTAVPEQPIAPGGELAAMEYCQFGAAPLRTMLPNWSSV